MSCDHEYTWRLRGSKLRSFRWRFDKFVDTEKKAEHTTTHAYTPLPYIIIITLHILLLYRNTHYYTLNTHICTHTKKRHTEKKKKHESTREKIPAHIHIYRYKMYIYV